MQPPSCGCVLKHPEKLEHYRHLVQPPSHGCVLKLNTSFKPILTGKAAAFGRLCVETIKALLGFLVGERQPSSCGCVLKRPQLLYFLPTYPAAAFARLCVETKIIFLAANSNSAATFGWLCVETIKIRLSPMYFTSCRLRAAVC